MNTPRDFDALAPGVADSLRRAEQAVREAGFALDAPLGDVIRSLDGSAVRNAAELLQILAKRQAGDQVKLGLLRDEDSHEMDVTLKRRNELFEAR